MQDAFQTFLSLVFNCGFLVVGPAVGFFIAKKRGVTPWLGAAVGLFGCIGWLAVWFLLPSKTNTPSNSAGYSFKVDDDHKGQS